MHLRPLLVFLALFLLPTGCRSLQSPQQELVTAASTGDLEALRHAMERGADPNKRTTGNETPLGILLLQYKAGSPDKKEEIEQAATCLLDNGAAPDALHHGFTPLQIATGQGSERIVSRLITYGSNPSLETKAGLAPIWQAVYDNNYRIGLELLKNGANPNSPNAQGQTPLEYLKERGFRHTKLMLHLRHYGGK